MKTAYLKQHIQIASYCKQCKELDLATSDRGVCRLFYQLFGDEEHGGDDLGGEKNDNYYLQHKYYIKF